MTYVLKLPPIYDYSEYEPNVPWALLRPRPALVILRASFQGIDGVRRADREVFNHVSGCEANGYPLGLYHWMTPNHVSEQADLFLSIWDKVGGAAIGPILDVEFDLSGFSIGRSQWTDQLLAYLERVQRGTGMRPIVYSSVYYWSYTTNPSWINNYGHWLAYYPFYPDNFTAPSAGMFPTGWVGWDMWQYDDKGRSNGYQANDLNIGSPAFLASIGASVPEPEFDQIHIQRPIADYDLCFSDGSGQLPLMDAVTMAGIRGWGVCMNGGCGFVYPLDQDGHVIPGLGVPLSGSFATFPASDGTPIYYARPLFMNGQVNPELSDNPDRGPWCVYWQDAVNHNFFVSRGLQGSPNARTQTEVAEYLYSLGVRVAYLLDSGRSAQIEENGTMLYWPYEAQGELVPQFIGLKRKSGETTMANSGTVTSDTPVFRNLNGSVNKMDVARAGTKVTWNMTSTLPGKSGTFAKLLTPLNWEGFYVALANIKPDDVTPPPPPPPEPTVTLKHTILIYSDGSLTVDGVPFA